MASSKRVLNLTNGCYLKHKRAERAITECASVWVEYGKTIRNLTLAENIQARNEQAKLREPLADAEIPGLKYEPAASSVKTHREGIRLAWSANKGAATGDFATA